MKGTTVSTFAALLLLVRASAEEVFTVTQTNYITPACFEEQYRTALSANPESLTTGIPIVFHYENEVDNDLPEQFVSTELVTHTKCSQKVCYTSQETKKYATTLTPSTNTKPRSKGRPTRYVYDTVTANENQDEALTGEDRTTTKTVFRATETPKVLFKPTTSTETITETKKNPLVTVSLKSKKLTHSVEESKITGSVTPHQGEDFDNSLSIVNGSMTHTIDLRISSTLLTRSAPTQGRAGTHFYGNSSTIAAASQIIQPHLSAASETSHETAISEPSSESLLRSSTQSLKTSVATKVSNSKSGGYSGDLFSAISTEKPPSVFPRKEHPLKIPSGITNDGTPYQTNKFFVNLFLDNQTDMIWSYPYGMYWTNSDYNGFAVQATNRSQIVAGSSNTNNKATDSYYFNPILDGDLIFSSTSLSKNSNKLSVTKMKSMSALVQLSKDGDVSSNYVEIPVVQGMGMVTAVYHGNFVAQLNSMCGVDEITEESSGSLGANILKYRVKLFNHNEWLAYVTLPKGRASDFKLSAKNPYSVEASEAVDGLILQLAVAPSDSSDEKYYDQAAGQYAVSASVEGQVSSGSADYSFKYDTKGTSKSGKTIVFALPHHLDTLSDDLELSYTGIKMESTTKGQMQGYLTNELKFSETMKAADVLFLPWSSDMKSELTYSKDQLKLLAKSANSELSVDIKNAITSVDSTYSSGKVLDKFAYILLVVKDILGDDDVAKDTLSDLKDAFKVFTSNKQYYPLMYDTKFGGVTSTAAQNGDTGADFGAPYYNDHHFHYGYYVHAAAVVGYVDKQFGGTWAEDNKDWVNSLIRDVANPSEEDTHFPVSRMFDWFAGHSWAAGLFASGDGRNEESSSEDYNFAYGMKMWGNVIGDGAMEARGNLMLSLMSRAMNKYFLYSDDNNVQPKEIIANKVSGIFFDNKVAYTTFFGTPDKNPEYVHGIHMLPITPVSSLIRGPTFVQEEWEQQVSKFIDDVDSGWTGILKLNQALYDPKTSYEFFSSSDWTSDYLDDGQSRTWSLAFSGGVANLV